MRTLTVEERRYYEEHGYVVVPDVFPVAELDGIDQEIDRLLSEPDKKAPDHLPGWVMQLGLRSDVTRDFAEDARLLSLIEEIVRPGIAIHSAKLVAKPPRFQEECHWHQDEAFYLHGPESASATRMSVWVPLQDADEHNGCLWVVPSSHRWGLQPFEPVAYGQCRRKLDPTEHLNEAIPVCMRAGAVLLFSAWLWHHSKGNQTERVRRAFIVSYQEATVGAGEGTQGKILRPAPVIWRAASTSSLQQPA